MTEVWVRSAMQYGQLITWNGQRALVHVQYEEKPRWFDAKDIETFSSRLG